MSPGSPNCLLIFSLDQRRFGLRLAEVEEVIRAVEITPVPGLPPSVRGVIDVRGRVIPVLNIRSALGLPERDLQLSDQFVVAKTAERGVAIVADEVHGLVELGESAVIGADAIASELVGIEGIAQLADGLVVIEDLPALVAGVPQPFLEAHG